MSSVEEEILEIEKYIQTLEVNDDTHKEVNEMIKDGMSKGLIYDFRSNRYRGTMFSTDVIKKEAYEDFQDYINRCEKKEYQQFQKWREDIINSNVEYSKDELKYNKISLI